MTAVGSSDDHGLGRIGLCRTYLFARDDSEEGVLEALRAGRTVVCNVSRAIIDAARRRYADVVVALVTAPPELLAARLRARGRDGDIAQRLARGDAFGDLRADCVIANTGAPEAGAAALRAVVVGTEAARSSATAS